MSSDMEGWILDLNPNREGGMTLWLKQRDGSCKRFVDPWRPSFYVGGRNTDLAELSRLLQTNDSDVVCELVQRYERLQDLEKSEVLKVTVRTAQLFQKIVKDLPARGRYSRYRIYNADLPLNQLFIYQKDIFPLSRLSIRRTRAKTEYHMQESIESVDYWLPPLRTLRVSPKVHSKGPIPSLDDPLDGIELKSEEETILVSEGNEADTILRFAETVEKYDPDFLITNGGGDFVLPYLAKRAYLSGIYHRVHLGRERTTLRPSSKQGNVYFSYGKIYYRPPLWRFPGRIHVDYDSFYVSQCGLEVAIEISRTCRMPLQRATSVTIGTAMTSIQLYQAVRDGVLIPNRKNEPEEFKNARELLLADRGGFYYEPKIGVHEGVVELDFASMYPTLMMEKNLSAETVRCKCCPNSNHRVPDLDYNICEKRRGIVPKALELLLKKRRLYKQLKNQTTDPQLREAYDARQAALKWILVSSFGYLGFKNARFGKIDSHIAVCAFARQILHEAAKIAETYGFNVVHGIVDSLWLTNPHHSLIEAEKLRKEIARRLKLPISLEGRYRWIIFLPSKTIPNTPVLTRYYGAFEDGTLKIRGIDTRRHDTPAIIAHCETEILECLARAKNVDELRGLLPEAINILRGYLQKIRDRKVEAEELAVTRNLSFEVEEYTHAVAQAVAARKIIQAGGKVSAGQSVQYIFTDSANKNAGKRVVPLQLAPEDLEYDVEKYSALLRESVAYLLHPIGYQDMETENQIATTHQAKLTPFLQA